MFLINKCVLIALYANEKRWREGLDEEKQSRRKKNAPSADSQTPSISESVSK